MTIHYIVTLTKDTGEFRYVRNRGANGVEHVFTVNESIAYRFPSEAEAKEAAGQYSGTAWTAEVVEANA